MYNCGYHMNFDHMKIQNARNDTEVKIQLFHFLNAKAEILAK